MERFQFNENEFPYGTLQQFGLTQEMIEDLPTRVLNDLYDGRRSPLLPIQVEDENQEVVCSRARFSLVRKDSGDVDVLFYPELQEADLHQFDEQQRAKLEAGKSIIATIENKEGKRVPSFVQIDPETKQVLSAPTQVIGRNLQVATDAVNLSAAELNSLQKGDVVMFTREDGQPISMGIDLNERSGIRFTPGDEQMWSEQRKRDWDKYTFGVYGCWVMGDDGNLSYVNEDDYTDEMWNEQKKAGLRAFTHQR